MALFLALNPTNPILLIFPWLPAQFAALLSLGSRPLSLSSIRFIVTKVLANNFHKWLATLQAFP